MRNLEPSEKNPAAPPEAWDPLVRLAQRAKAPIDAFLSIEAASGMLLLGAALVALIWANSPWQATYHALWKTPMGLQLGDFVFTRDLAWVVNDGLMVIFFFVVGLEIRREIHEGELSELRRAALPLAAALGGMIVPALLYLSVTGSMGADAKRGWGVPMATDIAFAVGVLTLLGKRCAPALRVLLLALAVIDDLGAILVIALAYSSHLALGGLALAALGFALAMLQKRFGVRQKIAYLPAGILAWAGVYASGVHPTIAGVLLGLMTPVQAWLGPAGFVRNVSSELTKIDQAPRPNVHELHTTLKHVSDARREALSPAESLTETLHPWVAFAIMPLFALVNAGVTIEPGAISAEHLRVTGAVTLGLLLGKPIGVLLFSGLSVRLGLARMPQGLANKELLVLGVVAGIGFTMSLFIAELAFLDRELLASAKLGVLGASLGAGVLGVVLGRLLLPEGSGAGAQSAAEAERSTEL